MNKEIGEKFYKPELDGLRFFAFLFVFIHHHNFFSNIPVLSVIKEVGWIGVDLFFVLSAFLFSKLLILEYNKTQQISYRKFFIRRIFRIWPVYILFILFCLILLFIIKKEIPTEALHRLLGLFTFTDNFFSVFGGYNEIIPFVSHLWTISFEEQFYIIVPLLMLFLIKMGKKNQNIFFIGVFIVFNILRLIIINNTDNYLFLWVLPFTHFDSIILGIMLGFGKFDFLKINPNILIIISFLLFGLILQFKIDVVSPSSIILYTLIGLSTVLMVLASIKSNLLKNFLKSSILVFLGKRSYGLYLYHLFGNFLGLTIANKFFEGSLLISVLVSLLSTILISVISYSLIEKPFLKLKKKYEVVSSRPI